MIQFYSGPSLVFILLYVSLPVASHHRLLGPIEKPQQLQPTGFPSLVSILFEATSPKSSMVHGDYVTQRTGIGPCQMPVTPPTWYVEYYKVIMICVMFVFPIVIPETPVLVPPKAKEYNVN